MIQKSKYNSSVGLIFLFNCFELHCNYQKHAIKLNLGKNTFQFRLDWLLPLLGAAGAVKLMIKRQRSMFNK
jgi:hypothetical protein